MAAVALERALMRLEQQVICVQRRLALLQLPTLVAVALTGLLVLLE
jgi:hypothetical protein